MMWAMLLLEPPQPQIHTTKPVNWINVNTPLLSDSSFRISVAFACSGADMMLVDIHVPAPGVGRAYAQQVETATRASQIASVLAGRPSSRSALGRVIRTRSMVLCDANAAVGGGVIDFGLIICDEADDDPHHQEDKRVAMMKSRSAVVSNVAFVHG